MKKILFVLILVLLTSSSIFLSTNATNQNRLGGNLTTQIIRPSAGELTIVNPANDSILGDLVSIDFDNTTDFEEMEVYVNGSLVSNLDYHTFDADLFPEGDLWIEVRGRVASTWTSVKHRVTVDYSYLSGSFKLTTYNIGESGLYGDWTQIIKEENADIAVLVETGGLPDEGTAEMNTILAAINAANPDEDPYFYRNADEPTSTGGEAVLSRFPIVDFKEIRNPLFDDGTAYHLVHILPHAVIQVGFTYIHVFTAHQTCCAGGESNRIKEAETISNYFDTLGEVPIIWAPDANAASPEDLDFNADTNLGTESLEIFLNPDHPKSSVVHKFRDVYRYLHPTSFGATYIDQIFFSRLDYIMTNEFFWGMEINSTVGEAPSSHSTENIYPVGSDHFPVNVWLNLDSPEIDLQAPIQVEADVDVFTTTSVDITWQETISTDIVSYNVYRDDVLVGNKLAGQEYYNDSGLTVAQIYTYTISGIDGSGNEGTLSPPLMFNSSRGELTSPPAPTNLRIEIDNGQLRLLWDQTDDGGLPITNYVIRRTSIAGFAIDFWAVRGNTVETTYLEDPATTGATLYYTITPWNELGPGPRAVPLEYVVPEITIDTSETSSTTTTTSSDTVVTSFTTTTTTSDTKSDESDSPVQVSWILMALTMQIFFVRAFLKRKLNNK